ncbi:hypothetical protein [Flavitalea sp.]|nr:hypothetical protein [Flavitalea sp.]
MSNIYRINFKELRQENLKDIFASFERALQALDIDFYLIGALARDTWFAQKNIRTLGTKDVDWAVAVSEESQFKKLKEFLIKNEGFSDSSSNEYIVFDKKGQQIDLLPFGAIEIESNKFIDSTGIARSDITGFQEVYEGAVEDVKFEGKYTFKVSSLPGIVILKLIAFDDRPEMRTKDIQDIGSILNNYFDIETEMIYRKYVDLFEVYGELPSVAARALGREMQPILNRNLLLKERLLSILYKNIEKLTESPIGLILVNVLNLSPASIEDAVGLLNEIVTGIHDKIDSTSSKSSVDNEYLKQVAFFRDITNGDFELTVLSPLYPVSPHSIFSKDCHFIKLSGKSIYRFYMIFYIATGETHKILITPNPVTSVVEGLWEIPLNRCQIKFELVTQNNHHGEEYCKLSFQLGHGNE